MPKIEEPTVNPAPRPLPVAVPIDTIPQTTRETSPEDAAERDAILAILADSAQGVRLDGYADRGAAETTVRRLGRTLKEHAPDGKALRSAITQAVAGGPWSLYLHWGEPRKGGRKAATA